MRRRGGRGGGPPVCHANHGKRERERERERGGGGGVHFTFPCWKCMKDQRMNQLKLVHSLVFHTSLRPWTQVRRIGCKLVLDDFSSSILMPIFGISATLNLIFSPARSPDPHLPRPLLWRKLNSPRKITTAHHCLVRSGHCTGIGGQVYGWGQCTLGPFFFFWFGLLVC